MFEDGRMVGVSEEEPELGPTGLAEEPISAREINEQGEFHAEEISAEEFEEVWWHASR